MADIEKHEQPTGSLQKLSQSILHQINNELYLSVYSGGLSTKNIVECTKKIREAFPTLPAGFYNILSERISHHKFSDERLIDAVNNVIDNCVYPTPTVAQFVSYDKRIRVLKYEEYLAKIAEYGAWVGKEYEPITFPDQPKPVWVHVNDIEKYKLKPKK